MYHRASGRLLRRRSQAVAGDRSRQASQQSRCAACESLVIIYDMYDIHAGYKGYLKKKRTINIFWR